MPNRSNDRPLSIHYRLLLLRFLGFAGGAGLSLSSNINCDFAVVAAAVGARAVRYAHVSTLAFYKRVGGQCVVRAAVCRVRTGVSHPYNHADTIPNNGRKDKPPRCSAGGGQIVRWKCASLWR